MTAGRGLPTTAEPNLTPILDMVFQLITFFMLVISFKSATMDPTVRLPVLGSAKPSHADANGHFIVLNIDAEGNLRVFGEVQDLESYLSTEARSFSPTDGPLAVERAVAAIIRADKSVSFQHINRVLTACKRHGFSDVTLKIMEQMTAAPQASTRL